MKTRKSIIFVLTFLIAQVLYFLEIIELQPIINEQIAAFALNLSMPNYTVYITISLISALLNLFLLVIIYWLMKTNSKLSAKLNLENNTLFNNLILSATAAISLCLLATFLLKSYLLLIFYPILIVIAFIYLKGDSDRNKESIN